MKKNVLSKFFIGTLVLFPFIGLAEVTTDGVCAGANMTSLTGIINWASCTLMSTVIPFLFSIAAVAFIWGIISYYMNPENEEKRKKGKSFIIGGLIALFIMTSMWGIIRIFSTTFGVKTVIPSFDNINNTNN
jgi:hypothetical protein